MAFQIQWLWLAFVHAYPGHPERLGLIHYHNGHPWSGSLSPSHSVVSGVLTGYYMTGNRRLLDVALEAADRVVRTQEPVGILSNRERRLHRAFTGPLRTNIALKILKSRVIYNPHIRSAIMRTGINNFCDNLIQFMESGVKYGSNG